MAEVDIASHDLMTKETSRTEPKQESTSHTLSVPAPMRIKASSDPEHQTTKTIPLKHQQTLRAR
ncbi:hypothetical protein PGTUg99_026541 [Puccinia graminis f. sp. tritici]|nr:hypothetical protein PGTUg99_026541 [Puccinia graminis f. sp. tritici]